MTDVQTSQLQTFSVTLSEPSVNISQLQVVSIYNTPSERLDTSQLQVLTVTGSSNTMQVSQLQVMAVVRGRIENRRVRAWGFSLDGHDFYVLRLGEIETVVYDLTTDQWYTWDNDDQGFWSPQVGMNWLGLDQASYTTGATSKAICGDDSHGVIWALNQDQGYDEHPTDDSSIAFTRKVVGGLPQRLRETQTCGAVYITAALGDPALTGSSITLRTSDDSGNSWADHGAITVTAADYGQEFVWRSLGRIKAPGRLFEISDDGATVRIDGLDMV